MTGPLWLGCGNAAQERPLWMRMLAQRRTRIVYWPFALRPDTAATADAWLRSKLETLDVEFNLNTWPTLENRAPDELDPDAVDLLWVGGGNTFRLLDHVRRNGFLDHVRRFWEDGGAYYGGSAGAVLACESVEIAEGHDPNEPALTDLSALGLLAGVAILPHYTPGQREATRSWAARHATRVLALPDSVGLDVQGDAATVVGRGVLTEFSPAAVREHAPGARVRLP